MHTVSRIRSGSLKRRYRLLFIPASLVIACLLLIGGLHACHGSHQAIDPTTLETEDITALLKASSQYDLPVSSLASVCTLNGLALTDAAHAAEQLTAAGGQLTSLFTSSQLEQAQTIAENWSVIDSLSEHQFPFDLAQVRVDYANGWGEGRAFGGERSHEGIDMFAPYGTEILSVCDGVVEKRGWLQLGGWRIGIRGDDGIYYYYAHMSEYGDFEEGDRVSAGDVLGYVGDSGYGEEGTTGMFEAHLHFGLYRGEGDTEKAFNPYPYLQHWEEKARD